jgi:hypothetical protein
MKKVFMLLAVAGFLASCNNSADSEKRTKDSLDSIKNATTNVIDSSAEKMKDSVDQTIDAQKQIVDSLHKDTTKSN